MSTEITEPARSRIFDALLGGVDLVAPRAVWIGLSHGAANRLGLVSEPSREAGYRRVRVVNTLDEFPAHSVVGAKANLRPIVFAPPTADWGVIRSLFIADGPGGAGDRDSVVLAMFDARPSRPSLRLPVTIDPGVLCLE